MVHHQAVGVLTPNCTGWGAVTLRQRLAKLHPGLRLPAEATISDIIERHGLVEPRQRRSPPRHPGNPYVGAVGPNDVWCTDFKGQFKMGDGNLCYPLTLSDWDSRYVLGCQGLKTTELAGVKKVFVRWFREYGPRGYCSRGPITVACRDSSTPNR